MTSEIIMAFVGVVCTGLSSLITFLLTKRKYNTEVDSQQLKNVDDSFELYKKVMNEAMATQDRKIAILQKENDSLKEQVSQLQNQVISLVNMLHNNPGVPIKTDIDPIAMQDM